MRIETNIGLEDNISGERFEITDNQLEIPESKPVQDRFSRPEEIEAYYEEALVKLKRSEHGRKLEKALPGGEQLRSIIEGKNRHDPLSFTASIAEKAGLDPASCGSLVHRVSELRTLHFHPNDVLNGTRRVEQSIKLPDGGRFEIDDLIQRGNKHYLRDIKPFNLRKFEEKAEGRLWADWMENTYGSDFRDRIRSGEINPFGKGRDRKNMDPEAHAALRDFLAAKTREHRKQLDEYADAYSKANQVDRSDVHTSVRWYWKLE